MILQSLLTCPECGFSREETIPTDSCLWYYQCRGCGALLRPKAGDCCVFCSYGTEKCPPIQESGHSCCNVHAGELPGGPVR